MRAFDEYLRRLSSTKALKALKALNRECLRRTHWGSKIFARRRSRDSNIGRNGTRGEAKTQRDFHNRKSGDENKSDPRGLRASLARGFRANVKATASVTRSPFHSVCQRAVWRSLSLTQFGLIVYWCQPSNAQPRKPVFGFDSSFKMNSAVSQAPISSSIDV